MATYGDDLGRVPGEAAEAAALPPPVIPPPVLPAATRLTSVLPAPDPTSVPATAIAAPAASAAMPAGAYSAASPNSYTDIRAVHEATTQQLRERRTSDANGRPVAIACAVVVLGGIAFVLGTVLL